MILSSSMNQCNRESFPLQWRIVLISLAVGTALFSLSHTAEAKKSRRAAKTYPIIRNILIIPKNVFDPNVPGEGHWPYTWANGIHFTTHPQVVRRELLFKPGDP